MESPPPVDDVGLDEDVPAPVVAAALPPTASEGDWICPDPE